MTEKIEISYPNIKQSWGIVGISILCMIVFSPVILLLNKLTGKEIAFLVYYLFAMGTTFWIAHQKRKKWLHVTEYNFDLSSAKIIILISFTVIAIQTGVISPIVKLIPMPDFMKKVFLESSIQNGVFSFITVVIAAPVLEELIFRGIILNGFLKIYSPVKSILISSILFGLIHFNPWQFIGAFIIGIFSGWVFYKTGKLLLSILIHFVNNLLAFSWMYFMDAETMMDKPLTELYGGALNLFAILLGAIIIAVICLHLLRLELNNIQINNSSRQPYG